MAEQKGIPLVINIAAAPDITEQGYKFVFRNFPTAGMILSDAFALQKEVFAIVGAAPKTVVFMHVNDTFGTAMAKGIGVVMPKFNMPYTIVEEISYDPQARDLSVEVAKAKATNAEVLLVVSRLNDAMLITRELVKQRWTPQAILSMGPGWYENQYLKTLGKLSDGPMGLNPWYDPNKKLSQGGRSRVSQGLSGRQSEHQSRLHVRGVAGRRRRLQARRLDRSQGVGRAMHATNITDNVSIGPGIKFDAKGQNDKVKCSAIQNRGGKPVTVAPKEAANAKLEWPMKPYQDRGEPRTSVAFNVYLNVAVGGVLTGLVYGLMALGLSVIFGVVRVVNFAHGEMMSIAMYIAVVLFSGIASRSAGHAGANRDGDVRIRLRAAGGADQSVHHPAGAQPVPAGRGAGDHHRQRTVDRFRSGRADREDVLRLRQLPARDR